MKKAVSILLIVVMVGCLAGCGSSKLSDNNTRTAKVIINAVDDYLDGKATAAATYEITSREQDNIDRDDLDGLSFSISVTYINLELIKLQYDSDGDVGKVKDERNSIASLIGASKYRG